MKNDKENITILIKQPLKLEVWIIQEGYWVSFSINCWYRRDSNDKEIIPGVLFSSKSLGMRWNMSVNESGLKRTVKKDGELQKI